MARPTATCPHPSRPSCVACSLVRAGHCGGDLSPDQGYPTGSTFGSKTAGGDELTVLARVHPIRIPHPRLQHQFGAGETRYDQSLWIRMVLASVLAAF